MNGCTVLIPMYSSVLKQSSLAIYKKQGQDGKHGCLKLSTYYAFSSIQCLLFNIEVLRRLENDFFNVIVASHRDILLIT